MTVSRWAVLIAVLGTASVVQPALVAQLSLPLGVPQVVVLCVAVLALLDGPVTGAVAGFAVGLLSDLTSQHLLGEAALVLTVVGALAGLVAPEVERSVVVPLGVVGVASFATILLLAVVGIIARGGHVDAAALFRAAAAAALYDVVLTPLVFPPLRAVWRRLGLAVRT